jgi:diaminohydroxyphosphoribosylaminopyrimidine deaminase/5-amino-6-(5-phosphoribosylamino)uracil reductase
MKLARPARRLLSTDYRLPISSGKLIPFHAMATREGKHSAGSLPFVTVKFAQSLDGRIATATGDSQWISSQSSLRFAHKLRREHDAIMVGIGTVLRDDPRLTVRLVNGRNPLRVIVDSRLRLPLSARVLAEGAARHTLVAATEMAEPERVRELERLGAEVLRLPANFGVDLAGLLAELGRRHISSVLVEGGARIVTSLLAARLVNRLVVAVAPKIIGQGTEAIGDLGISRLRDAIVFSTFKTRRLGPDIIFDGRLEPGPGSEG